MRRAFVFGLATNLANPKTAAFAASLFAIALPAGASVSSVLLAVTMICAISSAWYGVVSLVGSGRVFTTAYLRARHLILRATGVVFAGYGTRLGIETAAEA